METYAAITAEKQKELAKDALAGADLIIYDDEVLFEKGEEKPTGNFLLQLFYGHFKEKAPALMEEHKDTLERSIHSLLELPPHAAPKILMHVLMDDREYVIKQLAAGILP